MSVVEPPSSNQSITQAEKAAPPLPQPAANPNLLRDRLANERTFLAWLRTGIAIASLGFVVARFDIFLHELTRLSGGAAATKPDSGITVPLGVILVLAGPFIVVSAAVRFMQTERALLQGDADPRRLVRTVIVATTAGAMGAGAFLAVHLIASWPR
ncbi:MAG TPA: DUF202 domain-containing protein [Dehalococcoidia bacterium]|nr:DUF202 domain-containing protein [Dehalococcoidia bacterium]